MQNKIYAPSRFKNKQIKRINVTQLRKVNFGNSKVVQKTDKIEDRENKSKKYSNNLNFLEKINFMTNHNASTNLNFILLGTTGIGFTFLAMNRYRLGKVLKSLGKHLPLSMKKRLSKLSDEAIKDGLTGLFNRAHLDASINEIFSKAVKKGKNLSVGFCDIDNFKGVNEVFGHDIGDSFIKGVTRHIRLIAEKHGAKGFKYGGEEFVIVAKDKNAIILKQIMEEISEAIKKDGEIQSYVPRFKEEAERDIKFLNDAINQLEHSIFPKIRKREDESIDKPDEVTKAILSIIEEHIKKYKPADDKILNEIVKTLKNSESKELPGILSVNKTFGESNLGEQLDNIQKQCEEKLNDLNKWFNHLVQHGKFTISGGVVDLDSASKSNVKDGMSLVNIAEAALRSAKQNGRNSVLLANEEIIKNAS